ncbi:hypothetical protein SESBI_34427 [Sesbania bispinosa]|nr:hypothetical protein SESBI_34427 [Sesbania bispinosa]
MKTLKNANAAERRRNPLSDRTNSNPTGPNPLPSSSSCSSSAFKKPVTVTKYGADVSGPISSVRKHTSDERKKNQKKAVLIPRISNIRDKIDGVEGLDLPKAKPLTVYYRKRLIFSEIVSIHVYSVQDGSAKQRVVSNYEQDVSKDAQLQDFIKKQNAYFKEVDEYKLAEEEVESIDELD